MMNDPMALRGHLKITATDIRTNETEIHVDEKNIIVRTGLSVIPRSLNPKVLIGAKLGSIKFGKDIGIGTELKPTPPTIDTIATDQDVVFVIPPSKMSYTNSGSDLILSTSMNGVDIVGAADYLKYTSAAIYTDDGTLFSYKRFPFRLFSKWVRVNIEWTISGGNGNEGGGEVCPVLPFPIGVIMEAPVTSVEIGESIVVRGFEKLSDGSTKVVPNGAKWTTSNPNITLSGGTNGAIVVTGAVTGATSLQLRSVDYVDSRLIQIKEKVVVKSLSVIEPTSAPSFEAGDEFILTAEYTNGSIVTNVTVDAVWTVSPNLSIISKTSSGTRVKVLTSGAAFATATYLGMTTQYNVEITEPVVATNILILPLGNTRFDIGETLDITATIYYSNGTSALATINDRWVYERNAITLSEIGTVGNLRITAKYRGEYNIRVYVDGIEARLNFTIGEKIITIGATTSPQTPLHVIPNISNIAQVIGQNNHGGDIIIDPFYLTSSSPKLTFDGGIKVVGDGTYQIIVNKDEVVDMELDVISTTMTTAPLEMILCDCDGAGAGTITITITNPTASGVYIDHNDSVRRFYDASGEVVINYVPEDVLKFYGGCAGIKFTGGVKEIIDWGDFAAGGYEITSPALIKVPYAAPSVTTMANMFKGCSMFNQNLSAWCVTDFVTKPTGFDTGCVSWNELKPMWGTCPTPTEIYKIVLSPHANRTLAIGEAYNLEIGAINRMDQSVPYNPTDFTLTYDDAVVYITLGTDNIHRIEGLTLGITQLVVEAATKTATLTLTVE